MVLVIIGLKIGILKLLNILGSLNGIYLRALFNHSIIHRCRTAWSCSERLLLSPSTRSRNEKILPLPRI